MDDQTFRIYRKNPVKFVREVLGVQLRDYQIKSLALLDEHYIHTWARQTGKNYSIYATSIWKSLFYPGTKILIGTKFEHIRYHQNELYEIVSKIRDLIPYEFRFFKQSDSILCKCVNGSSILISNKIRAYQEYDYIFYNYEMRLPHDIEIAVNLPEKPIVHIFDLGNEIGLRLPRQIVTWKDVQGRNVEWAKCILEQLGPNQFKKEFLATEEDIRNLS